MRPNPPPARCDACGRPTPAPHGHGLAAGDEDAWLLLTGEPVDVVAENGRGGRRLGRGWVCRRCGHTDPISFEQAR